MFEAPFQLERVPKRSELLHCNRQQLLFLRLLHERQLGDLNLLCGPAVLL